MVLLLTNILFFILYNGLQSVKIESIPKMAKEKVSIIINNEPMQRSANVPMPIQFN